MGDNDIEIIDLSDDDDDDEQHTIPKSAAFSKQQKIPRASSSHQQSRPSSSKAVDDQRPSSSSSSSQIANGKSEDDRKDKTKNEEALAMFIKGILATEPGEAAHQITAKLEKKFYACSKKFQNSVICYELISKYHKEVQSCPNKKWHFVTLFKECLTQHAQVKAPLQSKKSSKEETGAEENPEVENKDTKKKKYERHLMKLSTALDACMKKIKEYDEKEVDLDDETGSAFIIKRKYEEKAAKIYAKIQFYSQKLTGEKGEPLKVRHPKICTIGATRLQHNAINAAIDKFVNRRTKEEDIQFPNYREVRSIVTRVNQEEGLRLSREEVDHYAQEALLTVGKRIKKCRNLEFEKSLNDLMTETTDDPADKDPELLKKLMLNKKISEHREAEILEKFAEESREKEKEEELESNGDENENEEVEDFAEAGDEDDYEVRSVSEGQGNDENSTDSKDLESDFSKTTKSSEENEKIVKPIPVEDVKVPNDETETTAPVPDPLATSEETVFDGPPDESDQAVPSVVSSGKKSSSTEKAAINEIDMWSDFEVASSNSDDERRLLMSDEESTTTTTDLNRFCVDCPLKRARLEDEQHVDHAEEEEALAEEEAAPANDGSFNPVIVAVDSQVSGFTDSFVEADTTKESDVAPPTNNIPSPSQAGPSAPNGIKRKVQRARKSFPRPPSPDSADDVDCVVLD